MAKVNIKIEGMPMEELKKVGERIRQARKEKHLSQAELAEKVQISASHMSDLENGKTNISLEIFMRITEALQVSADWLLQTNIPEVSKIQMAELESLLSDCSSSELQSLLRMLKEMKLMLRNKSKS